MLVFLMLLSYIWFGSAIELNQVKPQVAQMEALEDDANRDPTTFVYYFDLLDAFMAGAYANNYFPNSLECVRNAQTVLLNGNQTYQHWSNTSIEENTFTFLRDISSLVSNDFAEAYLYCHLTAYDFYITYLQQTEIYPGWLDWF